jgi:mercuric ion binding protein
MKLLKTILASLMLIAIAPQVQAQKVTETIKVSGNCDMCARKIEAAATSAGATKAKWDADTKVLTIKYNTKTTSNAAIQKSIAVTGYDTEQYDGDMAAYNALHGCCQYDGKRGADKK